MGEVSYKGAAFGLVTDKNEVRCMDALDVAPSVNNALYCAFYEQKTSKFRKFVARCLHSMEHAPENQRKVYVWVEVFKAAVTRIRIQSESDRPSASRTVEHIPWVNDFLK